MGECVSKIEKQACEECDGYGYLICLCKELGPGAASMKRPCTSCGGAGTRYVPEGYTQEQVEIVRHLVDALAVQQGVA